MNKKLHNDKKSFFSRQIFLVIVFLSLCCLWFLSRGEVQKITEFPPQPTKPNITIISPPQDFKLQPGMPLIPFMDNEVPKRWLYANSSSKFQEFRRLPDEQLVEESLPEFTDAINLNTFAKEQKGRRSIFFTVVNFERYQLLRVCYGLTGSNITAKMLIAKKPVSQILN